MYIFTFIYITYIISYTSNN